MNNSELAKYLARAIFECGDEPERFGGKVQRIQFKGGNYAAGKETNTGGLNEQALASVIEHALAETTS